MMMMVSHTTINTYIFSIIIMMMVSHTTINTYIFSIVMMMMVSHTTIIHPILRRLAKIHSESDLLKATPHIKFHFQFSSVQVIKGSYNTE